MNAARPMFCGLVTLALGCDEPSEAPAVAGTSASVVDSSQGDAGRPRLAAAPPAGERPERLPPMPRAKDAFEEVVELIEAKHLDGKIEPDVLWTGAAQGVLDQLPSLPGHRVNKLLTPRDLEELRVGTKGQLVAVGVMIERVAGVTVIRDVVAGGPAQAAGLRPGDRILGVDGQRISEEDLMAVTDRIRGPEGTEVTLFVQRDTEEWDVTIERRTISFSSVDARVLEESIGYLRIRSFAANTPEDVVARLSSLQSEGVDALVLDVRDCPGGLVEASVEVAERFLPPGEEIVSIEDPSKGTDVRRAEASDPTDDLELVVLVNGETASGAEILAGSLAAGGRALLVGERTLGKQTIESVHELSNGWGLKLSVSRFGIPGAAEVGGLRPSIVVPSGGEPLPLRAEDVSVEQDPQLSAAVELLRATERD